MPLQYGGGGGRGMPFYAFVLFTPVSSQICFLLKSSTRTTVDIFIWGPIRLQIYRPNTHYIYAWSGMLLLCS